MLLFPLILLHSEWPKLYEVLAILSAVGVRVEKEVRDKKNRVISPESIHFQHR